MVTRTRPVFVSLSALLLTAIAVFGSGFFWLPKADAAVDRVLPFSAKLQASATGNQVPDGTYAISFRIYQQASGGSALWSETHSVGVESGAFSVYLGTVTPLPDSLTFSDGTYYLGVQIESDSEMSPRQRIGAVPVALNADTLRGLVPGVSPNNVLQLDGSGGFTIQGGIGVGGSIVPTVSGINLGSSSNRFSNLYVDNLSVAGTDLNGTSSQAFTIDSGQSGNNGDAASLRFYLGPSLNTYAALQWNGPQNRFDLLAREDAGTYANLNLQNLTAAGTLQGSGLAVGGTSTLEAVSASGAVTLGSSLSVTGTASFGAAVNAGGSLAVSGSASFGSNLSVTGAANLNGGLQVAAGFSADTASVAGSLSAHDLTVSNAASLGGVTAGSLSVTGSSSLAAATFSGNLTVGSSALTVAASTGNVATAGTLTVLGTANLAGLSASGGAVLGSTLQVADTVTLSSGLSVAGTASLGALSVTNAAALGSLSVSGTSSLAAVTASGTLNVGGGNFTVAPTGNTLVGGTLNVSGASSLSSLATSGSATLNSLSVTNAAAVGGNFSVTGSSNLAGTLQAAGDVVLGTSSSNSLSLNGRLATSLLPAADATYDLGSASLRFNNFYAANAVFDQLQTQNTTADDFTINSDNGTADAEDSRLIFSRGTVTPSAFLKWDSSAKQFVINQPLTVQGAVALGASSSDDTTVSGGLALTNSSAGQPLRFGSGSDALIYRTGSGALRTTAGLTLGATGTADSGTTTRDSQGLSFLGSYWNGAAADATGGISLIVQGTTPDFGLALQTSGTTRLYVGQSGNVGIGTTNPGAKLDVAGAVRLGAAGGSNDILNTSAAGGAASGSLFWGNQALVTASNLGTYGVASLNGLSGTLTLNNASGSGSAITINNALADGSTKGIASFNGTNFSASSGVVNTAQDINTAASPTFAGLTTTGAVAVGGVLTLPSTTSSTVPLLTFSGETTTGLGHSAAGVLNFIVNGTSKVSLANSTAIFGTAILTNSYTRIGSTSAPNNQASGDLTASRINLGNVASSSLLYVGGNVTASAWGASGIQSQAVAGTFTDTSSSGTVALNAVNSIARSTLAASSATTYTDAASLYIQGAPIAGTNATLTNSSALYVATGAAASKGIVITGAASQSVPLLELSDGGNAAIATLRLSSSSSQSNIDHYDSSTSAGGPAVITRISSLNQTNHNSGNILLQTALNGTLGTAVDIRRDKSVLTAGYLRVGSLSTPTNQGAGDLTAARLNLGNVATSSLLYGGGNLSAAAWGTAGIQLQLAAGTYTDSSSSGTVATAAVNSIGQSTIAASSATTYTDASSLYIQGAPVAGTNATLTSSSALYVATGAATGRGVVIQAATSQTASLLEFRDPSGTVLSSVASNGYLMAALGSAGAPGIAFQGDTNTGIFGSGSDALSISTGGTNRLAISTTSVTSTVDLVSSTNARVATYVRVGSTSAPTNTTTGDLTAIRAVLGADTSISATQLLVVPTSSSNQGITIKAATSQTAHLTEWQDSTGTAIARVGASGNFLSASYARVGSVSAPTNTSPGDLTAIRGILYGSGTGASLLVGTQTEPGSAYGIYSAGSLNYYGGYNGFTATTPTAAVHIGGNFLDSGWEATGLKLRIDGGTLTNTTSSGTVATVTASSIGASTLAASSATTYTNASTLLINGAPAAGTNVTITNGYALRVASGATWLNGNLTVGSAVSVSATSAALQANAATASALQATSSPAASATSSMIQLGSAIASGSSNGTAIGINYSGFTGNFVDYQVGGTSKFKADASGNLTLAGSLTTGTVTSTSSLALTSSSNGNINVTPNGSGKIKLTVSGNASSAVIIGDGGTTNYATFDTNGALTFSGNARPYAEMSLNPADAVVPGSGGCTLNTTDDTNQSFKTLDCAAASDQWANWQFKMPQGYATASNVQVDVYWTDTASSTTSNGPRFDVGYTSVANGATWVGASRTDVTGAVVNSSGQSKVTTSTVTLTAPSINANDLVSLRVLRKGTVDTLTDTVKIIGVRVKYLTSS